MSESNFWEGKKVVVTGGAGMIGSRLSELLLSDGATVIIMDNESRGHNYVPGALYLNHRPVDAGNVNQCANVFQGVDAVFNLAATVGGVYYNLAHQADMYTSNMRLQTAPASYSWCTYLSPDIIGLHLRQGLQLSRYGEERPSRGT
jgi:nucleoside-diphosphate-sugar epimerase